MIANVNRRAGVRAFTVEDFMPGSGQPRAQTPEQQSAILQLAAASMSGRRDN